MRKNLKYFIGLLAIAAVIGGIIWWKNRPAPLDGFARCLKENGAKFYGAFWCPHCQRQKKLFGRSERLLPYIECSTPDGRGQLPVCEDKGIEGYPTWEFADGSRESGELTLQKLSEKSGCLLSHPPSSP